MAYVLHKDKFSWHMITSKSFTTAIYKQSKQAGDNLLSCLILHVVCMIVKTPKGWNLKVQPGLTNLPDIKPVLYIILTFFPNTVLPSLKQADNVIFIV